ncbi:hypothetical protein H696_03088 [Fonticula alba]|uniref:Fe2OG dioxygenase domain-containing protein n=1 Tax=Fonticula alba TaxID=691883 RepID=A0A058ZBD4_FONAL|nr:hypothetical protein H696_03088 [Fonticula alba]KCV70737.1 hypothetical protein H696_03088 [Fonticula alba]|eukprot:XP_009495253.1 hypothetical protein H696_03088 [Fonticula alba]
MSSSSSSPPPSKRAKTLPSWGPAPDPALLDRVSPLFRQINDPERDPLNPPEAMPESVTEPGVLEAHTRPFPAARLFNLFDQAMLQQVRDEIKLEVFSQKSNDLYHFLQSSLDLKSSKLPGVSAIRDVVYSEEFTGMISRLVGVPLDSKRVDMSAHRYAQTNYLLCHDDELDSRRVAYIIYLVDEDWDAADGGALDMFDMDDSRQPRAVARSFVPKWGSFALFEVTPDSHHQVAEVLTASKERISISGWFHSCREANPVRARPTPVLEKPAVFPLAGTASSNAEAAEDSPLDVTEWISRPYLSARMAENIRSAFLGQGSIELRQFLTPTAHGRVLGALAARRRRLCEPGAADCQVGPANRRHLRLLGSLGEGPGSAKEADALDELMRLLAGADFARLVGILTGLADGSGASALAHRTAVSSLMFSHGDYTLVHDHVTEHEGLDLELSFVLPPLGAAEAEPALDTAWPELAAGDDDDDESQSEDEDGPKQTSVGGELVYLTADDTLLSSDPAPNNLLLVLRTEGVMRFTRYLSVLTARDPSTAGTCPKLVSRPVPDGYCHVRVGLTFIPATEEAEEESQEK